MKNTADDGAMAVGTIRLRQSDVTKADLDSSFVNERLV
jgi:hypothetical protein